MTGRDTDVFISLYGIYFIKKWYIENSIFYDKDRTKNDL